MGGGRQLPRRGLAAVELALLLPLLVFLCMATVDFARVIYALVTLQNCARNGALYEFYKACGYSLPSGWTSLSTARAGDAGNLTVTLPTTYRGNANPYSPAGGYGQLRHGHGAVQLHLADARSRRRLPVDRLTMTLTQSVSMPMPASTAAP